jgi:hypothetical protein
MKLGRMIVLKDGATLTTPKWGTRARPSRRGGIPWALSEGDP